MTDFRKNPAATARGIRNNNPFNLQQTKTPWKGKVSGTDKRFETFDEVENGIRAGVIDIVGDIGKDKQNTLTKLMTTFAPEHENDTTNYINILSSATGYAPNESLLDANKKLSINTIFHLSRAIITHENGPIPSRLITDYILLDSIKRAFESGVINSYVNKPKIYALPVLNTKKKGSSDPGYIAPTLIMILLFSILILTNK
jgi:hypothetical protein